jgi:8-oxo-dGTP diphosphatase
MAVIEREGKFLFGRRAAWKKTAPGYWCPISGKIEAGETEEEAVAREVFEEVGLVVEATKKLDSFITRDKSAHLHWWRVKILSGEATLKSDENSELRWVTLGELEKLEPAFEEDVEVFRRIVAGS